MDWTEALGKMIEKEGVVFEQRAKRLATPKQTVYDLPGRGRKPCECGKYVGVRTQECPNCGHKFTPGKKVEVINEYDNDPVTQEGTKWAKTVGKTARQAIVLTPSGPCPIILRNCDERSVKDWCEMMLAEGRNNDKLYTPSALKYYVRSKFKPPQSDIAITYLLDWIKEKFDASQTH